MERDIVIVGAGHNGLVAAFYLARAGFTVEIRRASTGAVLDTAQVDLSAAVLD